MILILDYDMGNIASIKNMLRSIGHDDVVISSNKDELSKADKIILPGVGSFNQGMKSLEERDIIELLIRIAKDQKKPILGICLGMQLLGLDSEEGERDGLGLIPFHTKRFRLDEPYKVPHMGWNDVRIETDDCPLLRYVKPEGSRYYFVHSYHAICDDSRYELMSSEYGYRFTAAVYKDNIYGVQFHPEKSHSFGKALLRGFVEL